MDRTDLLKKVGSMQQLAYVREIRCDEGRSRGMRAMELRNGPLELRLMSDKCLDISEFSWKGVNISFLSKTGLQGRNHYDTNGQEALRSMMGGMMFTSGLDNICAPFHSETEDHPLHGRIRTTPAEHLCSDAFWKDDRYVLRVSGEMREAELFGENLILRRRIESVFGERSFTVTDEIENQAFRPEPMMLLYHINFGYPLLDEDCEIVAPSRRVIPRDEAAEGKEDNWNHMDAPVDNEPEYVFLHDMARDADGNVRVYVLNDRMGFGVRITYTGQNLPYFMEWKSIASGDYVIGLEPANSSVYGRKYHEDRGDLHHLAPFAKETNVLTFTILEGADELAAARQETAEILNT